jgi:hypothetical protein
MIERYRQANPTPGFFKKYLMRQEIREELLRKNEKRWQRLTLAARELSPMELKTRLIEMVDSDIAVAEDMIKKLKEKI